MLEYASYAVTEQCIQTKLRLLIGELIYRVDNRKPVDLDYIQHKIGYKSQKSLSHDITRLNELGYIKYSTGGHNNQRGMFSVGVRPLRIVRFKVLTRDLQDDLLNSVAQSWAISKSSKCFSLYSSLGTFLNLSAKTVSKFRDRLKPFIRRASSRIRTIFCALEKTGIPTRTKQGKRPEETAIPSYIYNKKNNNYNNTGASADKSTRHTTLDEELNDRSWAY